MAELVYLQFYNNMAFQNTVIEHKVGKEIIPSIKIRFCRLQTEAMSHFQQEVLQVVKNGLFQISFSVTNARSFNLRTPK